ncbi:hypothetical protein [Salmonella enterica]|uniref:hypothetical protein n=1 Tax=Salmonella enterica TaxID=28901 RepID=UPI001F3FB579|nr:hypothetical protein [Salmonella enterica]
MDDCRTLRLWYGNQPALGAVWRRGQHPARAGAAFVVSAMRCAGAGRDVPDGGDAGALPPAMQFGYVNMAIVAVIFLCTLAFQPVSMRLRALLPECWLQRVFSGVLLMIATLILVTL